MDTNHSLLFARSRVRRALIGMLSVLVAGSGAGYAVGRARAAGAQVTAPMTYSGMLTDAAGAPLVGPKNIQLVFWDQGPTGGTSQCSVPPVSLPLLAGTFQLTLPPECTPAVHAHPELWSEVFVDGASLGRTKLGAVPYALEADTAVNAGGALGTRIANVEARITALEGQPAGKVAGMWMASPPYATGECVTIPFNTNWTPVAKTTVTFSLVKAATVSATYSINVQPDAAPGTEWVATHLVIDGNAAESSGTHYQPWSGGDSNMNLHGNFVGDLAAGSHTVNLEWATSGSARTWSNCPGPEWSLGSIPHAVGGRTVVVVAVYK